MTDCPLVVVEDDADIREVVAEALRLEGFPVSEASDGRAAIEHLAGADPCVVITDLMMPGMSGWDLIRQIRRTPEISTMPVVVISAAGAPTDLDVDRFFAKPFDLDALVAAVRELSDRPRGGASPAV